jgi:hypothetical protein
MNGLLYHLVSWAFDELIWGGDLVHSENLPSHGPAVIVSNHLGALGPIAVGGSVPLQLHAWIHADMLDPELAPDYLRRDFVERQLHLSQPFSGWLAALISKIHVPLLRALGGVPVYPATSDHQMTFDISVGLLEQRMFILIFPEDPSLPMDPRTRMTPFKKGFTRLGELYYQKTGKILSFHPLAVHAESFTVRAGSPVRYNPLNNAARERIRIKNQLEDSIHGMYLEASHGEIVQLPLPN